MGASLELFEQIEVDVDLAVDGHRFAHRLREERLDVGDAVLRVHGDRHVPFDRFAVRVPKRQYKLVGHHHFHFVCPIPSLQ